jgi:hypothetical protein
MFPKDLINYQEKLYWVYKKIKQTHIKPEFVQDVKMFWDCDIVLRHRNQVDEYILFLREIPDLEIVNDGELIEAIPDLK